MIDAEAKATRTLTLELPEVGLESASGRRTRCNRMVARPDPATPLGSVRAVVVAVQYDDASTGETWWGNEDES